MDTAKRDHALTCFAEAAESVRLAGEQLAGQVAAAAEMIAEALAAGGGVFVFGNGGSAADAQHIAGELVGRYLMDRRPFRAEALTTDASTMTAIANDLGFEKVFARQLEGKARPGDIAWGISTSGASPNVVAALGYARENGLKTIALTGPGGGECAALADVLLAAPADRTPRVQEIHVMVYHTICELVEAALAQA
ncbi:MAG: D-sedoheptulose-7-phosphate isomerase [Planctomycetota bacterium]|jgi:D-sedoheptulose 7-phosphate isomerase